MLFAYRLAAHLGMDDPVAMLARMTPEQLDNWIAYDALEPIGQRGLAMQLAMILQAMMAHGGVETDAADWIPGLKSEE